MVGRVDPAAGGDRADRLGHRVVGEIGEDAQEVIGIATRRRCDLFEGGPAAGRGHPETIGVGAAEQQVHIGDRQGAAGAVARGTGRGARRLGPDFEVPVDDPADRPASRGHGVQIDRRTAHLGVAHDRLVAKIEGLRGPGDIGAGATHVEADDRLAGERSRRLHRAENARRRSAQERLGGTHFR